MLPSMATSPSRVAFRAAPWLAGLAIALGATAVRADERAPVVVVVESEDGAVPARALRVAIARAGVPAYALSDDAAPTAEGTLTIAVPADGPIRMRFTDPTGHTRTREVDQRRNAAQLARIAVRLVVEARRDREPGSREVLDPWRDSPPRHRGDQTPVLVEVLDPWSGEHPNRLLPYSEVLDPWAAVPSSDDDTPAVSVVSREVIDPWADETGPRLDSPRR